MIKICQIFRNFLINFVFNIYYPILNFNIKFNIFLTLIQDFQFIKSFTIQKFSCLTKCFINFSFFLHYFHKFNIFQFFFKSIIIIFHNQLKF